MNKIKELAGLFSSRRIVIFEVPFSDESKIFYENGKKKFIKLKHFCIKVL